MSEHAAGAHRGLFLRNARWALASMILRYGVSFAVTLALARMLGVNVFGQYQYYLSVFAVIEGFATIFNYTVIQNELIGKRMPFGMLWASVRWLMPLLTLGLLAGLWAYTQLMHWDDVEPSLLLLLHVSLLFKISDFLAIGLVARLEQHLVQICDIAVVLVFNVMRLAVLWAGGGLEGLIWCTVAQYALTLAGLLWVYRSGAGEELSGHFDGGLLWGILKKGFPMYAIAVLAVLQARLVNLILPELMTTADLGLFSFASKMMEPVISAVLLPLTTALPFLAHAFHSSRDLYWQRMGRLLSLTTLLGALVALGCWALPIAPVLGWVKADFVASAPLFPILALSIVGQCFSLLCNSLDILHDKTSRALIRYLFVVLAQTLLSVVLIRAWGLRGAAFSAFLAPVAVNLAYNQSYGEGRLMNRQWFALFSWSGFLKALNELKHQLKTLSERKR